MTQEQLLVRSLKNNEEKSKAFRELVSLYKVRLYWHIRSIVIDHHDTDDVLQNTFIKVFQNIDKFKGDSKIYTWMYRIATNESLSFLQSKARRQKITLPELKDEIIDNLQSDIYFKGSAIEFQFQKAIAILPEKQQLVFNMKYFGDHTFDQLSEILDTSVGGLKSNYHHAVKKISAYINNSDHLGLYDEG